MCLFSVNDIFEHFYCWEKKSSSLSTLLQFYVCIFCSARKCISCFNKSTGDFTGHEDLNFMLRLISGFRSDVDEICALLGYYAASCGNCLPTFRDCYPARTFQNIRYRLLAFFLAYLDSWPVKMGPIRCPETSVNSYHTTSRNIPEESRSLHVKGFETHKNV
jgi:hypothetical protein